MGVVFGCRLGGVFSGQIGRILLTTILIIAVVCSNVTVKDVHCISRRKRGRAKVRSKQLLTRGVGR